MEIWFLNFITIKCSWLKQINILLTEIYKTFSGENPYFYEKHFHEKRCNVQSKRFGVYSISLHASHLWNQLPDHIKYETSVKGFKN